MNRPDIQEVLALHNMSATQRGRRLRNAGISIAYNVAVRFAAHHPAHFILIDADVLPLLQALNTKLGQLSTAASLFQLALRLEHRRMADTGNRADALHGMALVASHSGLSTAVYPFLLNFMLHQATALPARAMSPLLWPRKLLTLRKRAAVMLSTVYLQCHRLLA
jgi:hypothetical protein